MLTVCSLQGWRTDCRASCFEEDTLHQTPCATTSFYYLLQLPLSTKAVLLVAAAALLALAWLAMPRSGAPRVAAPAAEFSMRAGIGLTLLAALGAVNVAIWQKEALIAGGQPV